MAFPDEERRQRIAKSPTWDNVEIGSQEDIPVISQYFNDLSQNPFTQVEEGIGEQVNTDLSSFLRGDTSNTFSRSPVPNPAGFLEEFRDGSTDPKLPIMYSPTKENITSENMASFASDADLNDIFSNVSQTSGLPVSFFRAVAKMESGFDTNAYSPSGRHKGLFQMGEAEFKQYSPDPNGSRSDPYLNTAAMANYAAARIKSLETQGIPISPSTIYLSHQQGAAGLTQIYRAANGQGTLSETIKRNMRHNPPQDGKGVTTDPQEFIRRWDQVIYKNMANEEATLANNSLFSRR